MKEISVKNVLLAHRQDPKTAARPAIKFEDEEFSYGEYIDMCSVWAKVLHQLHNPKRTFHIGVLLDNGPNYCFALGAAAFLGAGLVGINPTRRGEELTRDISHTDCEIIITESRYHPLLEHLESELDIQIFSADEEPWLQLVKSESSASIDKNTHTTSPVEPPEVEIDPKAPYLLLFTSGTTGSPKAAICSQERFAGIGKIIGENFKLTFEDVCYQAMPMFHSNALMAGWMPCVVAGATGAFRRRFSASNWLSDVQKFGATYFNYVGKPLTYILATPETPDDKDHKLRMVFGNEGAAHDLGRFEKRFGVKPYDSYGSTEGGLAISRTDDTPPGALGKADEFTKILDPETEKECPVGIFDASGKLLNADEATGEMVHLQTHKTFEGYWNNVEADQERTHGEKYWSGDLGYKDAEGYVYFAGRNFDWLRVDGENFAAAPLERILVRHPAVDLAAVYAVPNPDVGDDVMAAIIKSPGAKFEPQEFLDFLVSQSDMGTKWTPKYIRWADDLAKTPSMKILKRVLRQEHWASSDETWMLEEGSYRLLTAKDIKAIAKKFKARGREKELAS